MNKYIIIKYRGFMQGEISAYFTSKRNELLNKG